MSGLGEQLPFAEYGDLVTERNHWMEKSYAAASWIDGLANAGQRKMLVLAVRCPKCGCLLGEVFCLPLDDDGERYLLIAHTTASRRAGFLNWPWSDDYWGHFWLQSSCRHGKAKLEFGWLLDCVGAVRGWHHMSETVEEARAEAPKEMQKGVARRIFHPRTEAWRPR